MRRVHGGVVVLLFAGGAFAQAVPPVDRWVALRYRGAHLLPDTVTQVPAMAAAGLAAALAPRVEAIRAGTRVDTLWAVHFSAQGQGPTLAVPSTVRLASPTGTVTTLTARLVGRRPFRAPRTPAARVSDTTRAAAWRHGWAYLALLPHDRTRNAARYRGWLLLGVPEPPVSPREAPARRGPPRRSDAR